jgi:hypothetical protein
MAQFRLGMVSVKAILYQYYGPDPDPDSKISKNYTHGPKSEATEILKVHMAFTLNKKVEIG